MSSSKSGQSQAARRYAKALFELAIKEDVAAVEKDLVAFDDVVKKNNDLTTLMNSPAISRESKEKALVAVLEKMGSHKLTQHFIAILARNNRLPLIHVVVSAFLDKLMAHRGEIVAEVTSAFPLQGEQLTSISKTLTQVLGKNVKVQVTVDKKVLGGLMIKIGSLVLDNSLKSKLDRLGRVGENVTLAQAA